MKLWHRLTGAHRKQQELLKNEGLQLLMEIEKAHSEWVNAQQRLDYVIEKEQIDYAVYAMEAAEKRFEMLIKQAKTMNLSAIDVYRGRAMGG
ncbi:DUF2508 family protein [Paenibacillus sp. NPDC056579]|uniref:DUF2508 family protein n=1 Tax=unclassified Paenibacillus TaxID=185978 RepID=UPI001EF93422|nr:DUF2508 family protein [Paenibacillus sp. H1-7]ULL13284.1 DUF2508 family protein [Paenibacillus sp. H1-7]